ncbi:MAG: hypothetical protein PHW32_03925 [Bacilli bacterium]|nr:hypothetical protein [Bacilli bacterium]MDD4282738.1 hypothetical protein [Bacilli bacterium]MDD4718997.1 hypothetical protein [Bacilli bacterium]
MNENIELLKFIYQNSQMGIETISQLIDIAEGKEFVEQLQSQLKEYKNINEKSEKLLEENNCDEEGISTFEKIRTYLMINMQTVTDKSPSHIAEMLIIGSNMGVLDATKNLKKYKEADDKIINLMEKLLKIEEDNIQKLKDFL